jgi:hypothetical protein
MCAHILASSAHARASALTSAREVFEVNCVARARLKKKNRAGNSKMGENEIPVVYFSPISAESPPVVCSFCTEVA